MRQANYLGTWVGVVARFFNVPFFGKSAGGVRGRANRRISTVYPLWYDVFFAPPGSWACVQVEALSRLSMLERAAICSWVSDAVVSKMSDVFHRNLSQVGGSRCILYRIEAWRRKIQARTLVQLCAHIQTHVGPPRTVDTFSAGNLGTGPPHL